MAEASAPLVTDELFSAKGMVALVTGGGTGVGFMMAKALAEAGAHKVYIVGRREDVLKSAQEAIGLPSVQALHCDVTSKASLLSVVESVTKDVGYLNLLVCNSGIGGPQVKEPQAETSLDEWREQYLAIDMEEYTNTFVTNTTAPFYTTMAFLKLLDEGNKKSNLYQSSQVVVTSSIAGFNKRAPGGLAYGQSKAAATHLVKQLSVLLPQWDIRVNAIVPGLFPSEMSAPIVKAMGGDMSGSAEVTIDKNIVPLGRMGKSKEMAGSILYLASQAGAYCNGNIMIIDGGRLTKFPATF